MAVPQNKVTPSRRNKRRSHDALVAQNSSECANCGEIKRHHHICSECGYYNAREVIERDKMDEIDEDDAA